MDKSVALVLIEYMTWSAVVVALVGLVAWMWSERRLRRLAVPVDSKAAVPAAPQPIEQPLFALPILAERTIRRAAARADMTTSMGRDRPHGG